jgi:hypothetical protein
VHADRTRESGIAWRRIDLHGGRAIVVRPVSKRDVAALMALYESLPESDLYHRFFQARPPPRHTVEHMTEAERRGDICIVGELVGGDGKRTLVGEVACARLPNGNGELAITVSPAARGWTGPYLLALLCDEAAARGIPNMEADVMSDNRSMLALAQARGFAAMDHSECPSIVRVVFSTSDRVPTWPGSHDRPRVVVEAAGARWHAEDAARAAGMQLLVCPGPTARWSRCPAMRGRPCPLAGGADLIVDAVDPESSDAGLRLLEAHREMHRNTALFVEPPSGQRASSRTSVVDDLFRALVEFVPAPHAADEVK